MRAAVEAGAADAGAGDDQREAVAGVRPEAVGALAAGCLLRAEPAAEAGPVAEAARANAARAWGLTAVVADQVQVREDVVCQAPDQVARVDREPAQGVRQRDPALEPVALADRRAVLVHDLEWAPAVWAGRLAAWA